MVRVDRTMVRIINMLIHIILKLALVNFYICKLTLNYNIKQ